MPHTTIHLVRHGEVHNPDKILYGRLPRFRLTDKGRSQARAAGRFLSGKPVQTVWSSPLLRARQTASEILLFFNGRRLQISRRLIEVDTIYEGMPGAHVDALHGDIYTGTPPPYEQPEDLVARIVAFFAQARRRFLGEHVVAVTHGDVIVFAMLWAKGFALSPDNKVRLKRTGFPVSYPAHASVTTFTYATALAEERPSVAYHDPLFTI